MKHSHYFMFARDAGYSNRERRIKLFVLQLSHTCYNHSTEVQHNLYILERVERKAGDSVLANHSLAPAWVKYPSFVGRIGTLGGLQGIMEETNYCAVFGDGEGNDDALSPLPQTGAHTSASISASLLKSPCTESFAATAQLFWRVNSASHPQCPLCPAGNDEQPIQ